MTALSINDRTVDNSSVYPTLACKVAYGSSKEKVECVNNAVKCFCGTLEHLVQDKPSYIGKGKLTEVMRKWLTKPARCAIIMKSCESNEVQQY